MQKWQVLITLDPRKQFSFNPLSINFTKWSNTPKQFVSNLLANCLSVFDHFVGLALKGLILYNKRGQDVKKGLLQGKWVILSLNKACSYNCGFPLRIFFTFCIKERIKRYTRIILMVFPAWLLFGPKGSFTAQ